MMWWNWIAMFLIVVVAPSALLIWLAESGNWFTFALAIIGLIGAVGQAIHTIQQRQAAEARSANKVPETRTRDNV